MAAAFSISAGLPRPVNGTNFPVLWGTARRLSMTFSYTQVSQYLRCPRSYRYRYLDGWREKESRASLCFGRCFEKALEHFHYLCSVFGAKKESLAVCGRDGLKGSLCGQQQFALRAGSLAAEDLLDLAPHIFDGVEVG